MIIRRLSQLVLLVFIVSASEVKADLFVMYTYAKDELGREIDKFANLEQIAIKKEFYSQDNLKTNILRFLELGEAPDAVIMPADHLGLYNYVGYSELDQSLFPAPIQERIWKSATSDGNTYGVPIFQGNHLMMFYNKSLVTQPALSWKEVFEQQIEFRERGLEAIAWSYDEPFWFLPVLGAFGGWPIHDGVIQLDSPEMVEALKFYKSLKTDNLPYPNCSYACTMHLFKTGKVAYTINGEWAGKEFSDALGENLGVTAIPSASGNKSISAFSTHTIAFPNNSLNASKRKLLLRFANYLQSEEIQLSLWNSVGAIPVNDHALSTAIDESKNYLKSTLQLLDRTRPLPSDQAMTFIWDAMGKGHIRHQEGAVDAEGAAQYMQTTALRHMRNAEKHRQEQLKSGSE